MAFNSSLWTQLGQLLKLNDKYQVLTSMPSSFYGCVNAYSFKAKIGANEVELCIKVASENGLVEFTKELLWQKIFSYTRLFVVPEFWSNFVPVKSGIDNFDRFSAAVGKIANQVKELQTYFTLIDRLARNASPLTYELYTTHLSSILLSQIPKDFEFVIFSFYSRCFRAFNHQEKSSQNPIGLPYKHYTTAIFAYKQS